MTVAPSTDALEGRYSSPYTMVLTAVDAFGGRAVVRRWRFTVRLACGDERRFGNLVSACTVASPSPSSSCDTPACHTALEALTPDDVICLPHLANVSEQIAPW